MMITSSKLFLFFFLVCSALSSPKAFAEPQSLSIGRLKSIIEAQAAFQLKSESERIEILERTADLLLDPTISSSKKIEALETIPVPSQSQAGFLLTFAPSVLGLALSSTPFLTLHFVEPRGEELLIPLLLTVPASGLGLVSAGKLLINAYTMHRHSRKNSKTYKPFWDKISRTLGIEANYKGYLALYRKIRAEGATEICSKELMREGDIGDKSYFELFGVRNDDIYKL